MGGVMPLTRDAKVQAIKGVPLFSRCAKKELAEVAKLADEIDFGPGRELILEGALGREFFVLIDGEAEVQRGGRKVRTLRPGDFFGEIALIARTPRTATVTTAAESRLLVITAHSFRAMLNHQPVIATKVLTALAERLAPDSF
jgi:CRP/FNR family transcriptional regulator, cyclic AMP receptor protein